MGAIAIDLDLPTLEGAGGYAREMTEDRAIRQRELLAPYVAAADALITTAAVPGRRAPLLVSAGMVRAMKPGSVVVDLAAESGGNVQGVAPGSVIQVPCASGAGSVTLWGGANVPSQMPNPASRLYASNIVNVLELMTRDGAFASASSNNTRSMAEALFEKTLKLTPSAVTLAPSGALVPAS